jgi:hypothetical protein
MQDNFESDSEAITFQGLPLMVKAAHMDDAARRSFDTTMNQFAAARSLEG